MLSYLLLIPKVTVVTACRDFDCRYDRRIAVRQWECELHCPPLDWETEIEPLLAKFRIDSTAIDIATRELIRNPLELALFVELAKREDSFNVVTSQALAQRYLKTIVQDDPALGDEAMQAIEAIANAMLKSRSLSIPHQRFSASQDILQRLKSLNVLQDTHDGKLAFGHQTLLDVLVISSAIRQGVSLNTFIQDLPPVPFVRPSIRSFVAQLATDDRPKFRKQLRTVLTSDAAFHIRRLVAESFAQQKPQNDDWSLIRDLRDKHRDVFQVIYTQASLIEWHHFWLSHLVPLLQETRDAEGLAAHVYRVARWQNEDAARVLAFWMEALDADWLDSNRIAEQLAAFLRDFKTQNLPLAVPLLERLLNMPKPEYGVLGRAVARCVDAGAVDDKFLWHYIAGDIYEDDVTRFPFDNKLRCQPRDFRDRDNNFLAQRMVQSTALLDLALDAVEQWSQIKLIHCGATSIGYHNGFLWNTSYRDIHSQNELGYLDGPRVLFNAIEGAILHHAQRDSNWWQENRERLCFNHEAALCYFAILALTNSPQPNTDLIGRLLCDRTLLESALSYELGELIQTAFIYLDGHMQDAVMAMIQNVWEEPVKDEETRYWILKNRAEYVSAIPCYCRSPEAQAILDAYEKMHGTLIRQPPIHISGGMIIAPFSFEIFLKASDKSIIYLLAHYSRCNRDFDNFFVGGKRDVGCQLREASSRHPSRFLKLLVEYWSKIPASFRDNIMEGIASYLEYCYGNLKTPNTWIPFEEPDAPALADQILDELDRHPAHWCLNRYAAQALKACAHVIKDEQNGARLAFWAIGFGSPREESITRSSSYALLNEGINMASGNIAEALIILVNKFHEHGIALPELLPPTLRRFASSEHPAIRALILRRLPYLQSQNPELGWDLFHLAMQDAIGLWQSAERCLYHAYQRHFEKVVPLLERIYHEGSKEDMETWGRISTLSALAGQVDFTDLLGRLKTLDITEAWKGAASVWTHPENIKQYREQ